MPCTLDIKDFDTPKKTRFCIETEESDIVSAGLHQAKGGGGGGNSPRSKAYRAALTGMPASQGTPT
jgi:hypothetical protein